MSDSQDSTSPSLASSSPSSLSSFTSPSPSTSSSSPPWTHQQLAKTISVVDNTIPNGAPLTLIFVRTGKTSPSNIPSYSGYSKTGLSRYSFWEYRCNASDDGTVGATMLIFGPDDKGQFLVEISRASMDQMTVTHTPAVGDAKIYEWHAGVRGLAAGLAYFVTIPRFSESEEL